MATIDNNQLIQNLIANNGHFDGDPQVYQIVQYTTVEGKVTHGITWVNESPNRLRRYEIASEYIINPKLIWRTIDYAHSAVPPRAKMQLGFSSLISTCNSLNCSSKSIP